MPSCPDYEVPPGFQLRSGGSTGPVDCMPWAASRAIGHATCGARVPSGRTIRLLSNEPTPDPMSPGLRLQQVADVAREDFGVYFEVHGTTYSQVSWAHYERQRLEGRGCVIAIGYSPIASSQYDAGRGFDGNHALFESLHATYDPLADGRAAGVWLHDGRVYPRSLIRDAAGELRISGSTTVKDGYVWAAFTRDVVPEFRARVPAGDFNLYTVSGGVIVDRDRQRTGGFSAPCSPPKLYKDAAGLPGDAYKLSRLQSGSRAGYYVPSQYVQEV